MAETAKYYRAKEHEKLETTARKVVALTGASNLPVHIKHRFNTARGIPNDYQPVYVTASPDSTTSDVKREILEATQQQLASVNELVTNSLDHAIARGLTGVVQWVRDYTDKVSDGRDLMAGEACDRLKAAGYQANEFVGAHGLNRNKYVLGRFIVGQLLSNLEESIRPHQMVSSWADQYLEMRDKSPASAPKVQPGA